MDKNNPCENCITLVMCKSRVAESPLGFLIWGRDNCPEFSSLSFEGHRRINIENASIVGKTLGFIIKQHSNKATISTAYRMERAQDE